MRNDNISIFVSSTSKDLGKYRQAVRDVIVNRKMHPIMMEHFPAVSRDAVDTCRSKVEEAQLFIGIYANRYGYRPNNGNKSITELEYIWAEELGLDRLIFVLDANAEFSESDAIRQYADNDSGMPPFLDRIGKKIVWKTFTTPEDLAHKVNTTLEDWEKQHAQPTVKSLPRPVLVLALGLALITLIVLAQFLFTLFVAGLSAIGAVSTLIGLFTSITPIYRLKDIDKTAKLLKMPQSMMILLLQFGLLLMLLVVRQPILTILADQQVDVASISTSTAEAINHFNSANALGADVSSILIDKLENYTQTGSSRISDAQIKIFAEILVHFSESDPDVRDELSTLYAESSRNAAKKGQADYVQTLVSILAILDPTVASELAGEFNDMGVKELALGSANVTTARAYFEAVRVLDQKLVTQRTVEQKSYSLQNLGYLIEIDTSLTPSVRYERATQVYQEALNQNSQNYEVMYLLSSLLVLESKSEADLEYAVELAHQGWDEILDKISPPVCYGQQDSSMILVAWNCFKLMTAEAHARIQLGESSSPSVNSLIDEAIALAEANDQFGTNRFTAEIYYLRAQILGQDVSTKTLCMIINERDRSNKRHTTWAEFANELLTERGERCRSEK